MFGKSKSAVYVCFVSLTHSSLNSHLFTSISFLKDKRRECPIYRDTDDKIFEVFDSEERIDCKCQTWNNIAIKNIELRLSVQLNFLGFISNLPVCCFWSDFDEYNLVNDKATCKVKVIFEQCELGLSESDSFQS
jgi:hypothetical protein